MARNFNRIVLPEEDRRLRECVRMARERFWCQQVGDSFREWVAKNTNYNYETAVRMARMGNRPDAVARMARDRSRVAAANKRMRARRRAGELAQHLTWLERCKVAYAHMGQKERVNFWNWAVLERDRFDPEAQKYGG